MIITIITKTSIIMFKAYVTKFLGIYIDDKLNWKYHINTVRSKLSKVAAIIYRASCLINQDGIYML